jgi:hypothetical protein
MTDQPQPQQQHRATPEQWQYLQEEAIDQELEASCILELRDRIKSLEASAGIGQPATPANTSAPADSLVERVMWAGGMGLHQSARAVLREVATWLSEHTDDDAAAYWAARLEQEAKG